MTATAKEDKRWGDRKKMEGEDGLKTIECLRGRLLAERQASKVAKKDAELLGSKLLELENKLRAEVKMREKAENKLNFLVKKLESLKNSPTREKSDHLSSSSENSHFSCTSSPSTPDSKVAQESESNSQSIKTSASPDIKSNAMETTTVFNQNHFSAATEDSSNTQHGSDSNSALKDSPPESSCESTPSSQDSKADNQSSSSSTCSVEATEVGNDSDNGDCVDNSLALVLASSPKSTKTSESKIDDNNKSVNEVLDALRHARERIESSMQRRHMIRVGPA